MARVLLTGARGMLGQRLHEQLSRDHAVVVTAHRAGDSASALDITDAQAVRACVAAARPEWIVNAAAYTKVDLAESESDAAFAVNRDGPALLAAVAGETGARLLHVGTDFVFDGEKDAAYVETDDTGPLGAYARSKEEGERRVREILPDGHLILRVSWLFGPGGGNFVDTMRRLGRERDRLRVVDDQRGTPTFTDDAAALARRLISEDLRGTIHGANRGETTWCGLARAALQRDGIDTPIDPITTAEYPTPAARPRNSALRNAVLEATIGDLMRPWEEALEAHLAWSA